MINIAVDIDGVVCDSFAYWHIMADRLGVDPEWDATYNGMYKNYTRDGVNFGDYLFKFNVDEWIENSEPFEGVVETVNKWADREDVELYFVTARNPKQAYQTITWLNKHGFDKEIPLLTMADKLEAPCNVLIDDKVSNVLDYHNNGRMGIIVDRKYNRDTGSTYLNRVDSLQEAFKQIEEYL